jgi:glycosyltransferase involved in cell wall biosynthesis
MSKPFLLFRGPVKSISGYGAHSRDLLESLYIMDLFDIRVDSCLWGMTPMNALDNNNPFHVWIEKNIVTSLDKKPDVYIQVTIPSEFTPLGNFNIGITAGIETTVAPKDWIDGCNRMDLVITTSNFSKETLTKTIYNETDKNTNQVIKSHRVEKPIEVLFEGVDTEIYNNKYENFDLNIKEDFAFLFVGHWLRGALGQDRKDVGMLIKSFSESFKGDENKPALILKTSSANFSIKERESFRKRIESLVSNIPNPPSVYLLFGELTNKEMNQLYNHPKIKTMVTFTKGEGFGRPLLEFTMTGKPVIASNWSGHIDFLPMNKSILLSGSLTDVHESAVDNFILKEGKWFTVNYDDAIRVLKIVRDNYDTHYKNSQELMLENREKYSLNGMINSFKKILQPVFDKPTQHKLILPKLTKIK